MKARPKVVKHEALVVAGVEGACLYIDGYRVAGPKPWGGGKPVYTFAFTDADLILRRGIRRQCRGP